MRADAAGEWPATIDQKVPGFSDLQALTSTPIERGKACYFMIYPDPPQKFGSQLVYMLMAKMVIVRKHVPFAVVVGGQPVYTPLIEISRVSIHRVMRKSFGFSLPIQKLLDIFYLQAP